MMALDDFVNDNSEPTLPEDLGTFRSRNLCPTCKEEGAETPYWYSRCTNTDCPDVTYMYPKRKSGL